MDPTNNLTPNPNADSAPSPEPENNAESSAVQTPEINSAPVNPIIQPSGSSEPVPGQASANPIQPLSNPIVRPSGLGATDPLLMPEKPQAPDPVEEELKAPMKAAAPVPGSIGSAVSGPSDGVTNAEEIERLNVDGVINSLLAEGMTKRVKDLAKRHGFDASSDFVESLNLCKDGEEVKAVVRDQELEMLKKTHDEILSHIPLEDSQKKFEF